MKIKMPLLFLLFCLSCKTQDKPPLLTIKAVTGLLNDADNKSKPINERLQAAIKADSIARRLHDRNSELTCARVIATFYLKKGDAQVAHKYFIKVVELGTILNSKEEVALALGNIGRTYNDRGLFDSAIYYYEESEQMLDSLHKKEELALNLLNKGIALKNNGNFQAALTTNIRAARLFDSLKDKKHLAYSYIATGNIFKELRQIDKSIEYHNDALEILNSENDSTGIAFALNNIGNALRYKKDYRAALSYYSRSLIIKELLHSKSIASTIDNIAQVYIELNELDSAEVNLLNAFKIRSDEADLSGVITTSNRLAKLYLKKHDLKRAEKIALFAATSGQQSSKSKLHMESYLILKDIYKEQGHLDLALRYAEYATTTKDSIFNSEMASAISDMQVKYETERKEKELLLVQQKAAADEERNKAAFRFLGIIGVLSLAVVFISFFFYRKRQLYLFKQEILEVKQEALIAQLDTHFISDTIDSINNFVENNDKDAASEYLLRFSRLIRTVLGNSLQKMVALQDDLSNLDDYFNLTKLRFPEGKVTMKVIIDEHIDPESTLIPPMVLQVLTENAIRHAFDSQKGGVLSIEVYKVGTSVHCIVADNGIGRKAAEKKKVAGRTSYGSGLAEKLMKIWAETEGKTKYEIKDLVDENGNSLGTQAEFSFPFISNI